MSFAADPKIRFGPFELDRHAGELTKHGVRLKIQGQPIQILNILLEQPGELVTREELCQRLWSADTFVDFEHSLNSAIRKLRQELGDEAGTPRYIETLPKRGYRFIGTICGNGNSARPIESEPQVPPQQRARPSRRLIIPVVVSAFVLISLGLWRTFYAPVGRIESVAVLPFSNFSQDAEQDFLAVGVTEELITGLSKIKVLRVISRTSVMRYKNTEKPLPQIGRELGVDAVVEGSVQRSGDRIRITAQLVKLPSEKHVWAESYERDLKDVLSLRGEIARTIAAEIRVVVTPQEKTALSRTNSVAPDAYEAFLKGRYFAAKGGPAALTKAISHFEDAVRQDPNYALAYAALAHANLMLAFLQDDPSRDAVPFRVKGQIMAERAIALDPNLAEAHVNIGDLEFYKDWDWARGEAEFRKAVELNPRSVDARQHYAACLRVQGRFDEASVELQEAHRLDPLSPSVNDDVAGLLQDSGKPQASIEQYKKNIELDPNHAPAYSGIGGVLESLGRFDEAFASYSKAAELNGLHPDQAKALDRAFRTKGIRGYWSQRLKMLQDSGKSSPLSLAFVYVHLDDREQALKYLEQSYREHRPQLTWVRARRIWEPLRSDQRFQKLLADMKFPT